MKTRIQETAYWIGFTLIPTLLIAGSLGAQVSEAATYYVAQTGNNSNTCAQAQSQATPRQSIYAGMACLSGGDTLQIRAGRYGESISNYFGYKLPSGGSWGSATTIMAFPGDTVWLTPRGADHVIDVAWSSYIVFDGIRMDATGTNPLTNPSSTCLKTSAGANHIRYKNGECQNATLGIQFAPDDGGYNEFLNSLVHDIGGNPTSPLPGHGFYISSSNNLVDGNTIFNILGNGIQSYLYGQIHVVNNNIYQNNTVYSANLSTAHPYNSGILVGSGDNNQVHNNTVYSIPGPGDNSGTGILLDFLADFTVIDSNTVYNTAGSGIILNNNNGAMNSVIENNVLWNTGRAGIDLRGARGNTVVSNNVYTRQ